MQAEYIYDGAGNRVQQVDHTGATPLTISYTNDVAGLTKVLVADAGAEQVYNLFGLDLIGQEEGSQTRTLLADGLGSVRLEMVEDDVESVTTYGPYGNLLAQTGNDEPIAGTDYGYTGEQHDASTGLLYLQARYYNPALRSFMGRDPWRGNGGRPQSMNGWSYVDNNSINLTDPTGHFPEYCKQSVNGHGYAKCVREFYGISRPGPSSGRAFGFISRSSWSSLDGMYPFEGEPGCFYGPVPYRAPGYVEGFSFTPLSLFLGFTLGTEIVYDFATMQREGFEYGGGVLQDAAGVGVAQYLGKVQGFRSWPDNDVVSDYRGWFHFNVVGVGVGLTGAEIGPGVGAGNVSFSGVPDFSIHGHAWYIGASFGLDPLPILDLGEGCTYYSPIGDNVWSKNYPKESTDGSGRKHVDGGEIIGDILNGVGIGWPVGIQPLNEEVRLKYIGDLAIRYFRIFNEIHYYSYGS